MSSKKKLSRRKFIRTVGGSVPTLTLMLQQTPAANMGAETAPAKFIPVDLSGHFTASSSDFGPREQAKDLEQDAAKDRLIRMPEGKQVFRGIPFWLGPGDVKKKSWAVLSTRPTPWTTRRLEIPVQFKSGFLCLAQFCDWDENEAPAPGEDKLEKVGQRLAELVIVYEDGSKAALPIRRRFEVNSPSTNWGHLSFASLPHRQHAPRRLTDALPNAMMWGDLQDGVWDSSYPGNPALKSRAHLWICALANPNPDRLLKAIHLEAAADDLLVLCGLTNYQGRENPLQTQRLSLYRLTLPEATAEEKDRWEVSVDLGVVARTYALGGFKPEAWLKTPGAGLGERRQPAQNGRHLYAEVAASREATLRLRDTKTGRQYEFELNRAVMGQEQDAQIRGARIESLEPEKVWLHGTVLDAATSRPTPVRLAFRSRDGRYIPPYGHRTEVNSAWFQDYGADIKLTDSSFAYVDGAFQVELPVGEVYLEMSKGFEYEGVRRKLIIEPRQRELNLEISRFVDIRSQGWVSADTHVHFLSPTTAVLEGQAEGLNLINLLAAQWGDLFSNVGDLPHGSISSPDGETLVWMGTENRQHILGHLGLLGSNGRPVYPMSASGPGESYIGDPLWSTLAEWAEACRKREGLVVAVHFPYPTAELAADIVLNKIDAVELQPRSSSGPFNNLRFLDWYRYLNCGYRLPAVGGTDKMGAWIPAGANRAYAYLGQDEFNFANWAKAVRRGNTFMTTGPLILFQAEGKAPGGEITLGAGGGTVEVQADVKSIVPVHLLEIVLNGKVVASREESSGAREMTLKEKLQVPGPGWMAARCASRLDPGGSLRIAAHSSPVYFRVASQDLFSATTASYLLTLIEGSETWVKTLATPPDPERLERVLKVFADAREILHRRMHEHGIPH